MLLLVFVLVLVALGMLAVALLTSSVLWGWIALVLSAAAAVVLVIDWLQRRSAVKAGSAAGARPVNPAVAPGSLPGFGQAPGGGPVPAPGGPGGQFGSLQPPSDVEPVTEVLPLVRDDPSSEAGNATDDTAVLPVVGPSGSAERPPGAAEAITQTGGDSSRSVITEEGAPEAGSEADSERSEDAAAARQGAEAGPQGSVQQGSEAPGDAGAPGEGGPQGRRGTGDDEVTQIGGPPVVDADGVTAVVPLGTAGVAEVTPPVEIAGPDEAAAPGLPEEEQPPREEPASRAGVEQGSAAGGLFGADAGPPASLDGQPPEEPRDTEIAAVVAGLEDEVLVVDEQPRYHLVRCRSLQGKPLIPLPVREAVELGFTPCGWCTPDRVLAGDRAQAR